MKKSIKKNLIGGFESFKGIKSIFRFQKENS